MRLLLVPLVLIAITSSQAQKSKPAQGLTPQPNQTDSALTAESRHVFESVSTNLLKAAREMPETSYNFRPVEGVRTFGELVAHVADVQATLCGNMNGHQLKVPVQKPSKDIAIKELADSVGECGITYSELSAENMNKLVQTPAGQVTHLAALVYILSHASEEYGQMSMYLRANHLAPPTSDDASGGGAGKAKS